MSTPVQFSNSALDSPDPEALDVPQVLINVSPGVHASSADGNLPNPSPDSQKTSSSNLTSSDKLSALPPLSPLTRRNIRRSLDVATSIPSVDVDSPSPSVSPNRFRSRPNSFTSNVPFPRASVSEGSFSTETPRAQPSGESDRISLPTMRNVRQAFSRIHRGSDPQNNSSAPRGTPGRSLRDSIDSLFSPSRSQSRAPSPLRLFQQWSAGLYRGNFREDPFVPIDPFQSRSRFSCICRAHRDQNHPQDQHPDCNCNNAPTCCLPLPIALGTSSSSSFRTFLTTTSNFLTDTLPRQIYLYLLLRLPSLYFSRVARIFEDAEVSRPDIQRIIDACTVGAFADGINTGAGGNGGMYAGGLTLGPGTQALVPVPVALPFPEDWNPPAVSPALARFKNSWEAFIDSLLREWKTLNVVSALLLSAIITMLQIPSAIDDPVTRHAALLSLVSALMSLSYGCVYIVRFVTMRSMYKASKWAEEARKTNTSIWWNVWVLLAMPAVWMAWSMIFFIICILSFVWRTGSTNDPLDPPGRGPLSPPAALAARIAITALFALGMVYFAMIVNTLRRYGRALGERGRGRAIGIENGVNGPRVLVNRIPAGRETGVDDLDKVMERRGRERERKKRRGRKQVQPVESGVGEKEKEGSGVRAVVGLGLQMSSQEHGERNDVARGEWSEKGGDIEPTNTAIPAR